MGSVTPKPLRIVCVGDSITDHNTYPQIVMQAFADGKKTVPAVACAGVSGEMSMMMAERLDRDALAMEPDIITFSAGTNDALHDLPADAYEKYIREVAAKCKAKGVKLILLTPCTINEGGTNKPSEKAEKLTAAYTKVIHAVAKEYGWPVAEVNKLQTQARAAGKIIMSDDGIHPNYLGRTLIARAVLDALGQKDLAVPKEFSPKLFPGVITTWKMKAFATADGKPKHLTHDEIAKLKVDDTWKSYTLPDKPVLDAKGKMPSAEVFEEQLRRNGFGLEVEKQIGKGAVYGVAKFDRPAEQKAFINTGAGTRLVWLNGKKVYEQPKNPGGNDRWSGFHAGKERLPVTLNKGKNTLVIEVNGTGQFFLSVTDKLMWEEDYAKTMAD